MGVPLQKLAPKLESTHMADTHLWIEQMAFHRPCFPSDSALSLTQPCPSPISSALLEQQAFLSLLHFKTTFLGSSLVQLPSSLPVLPCQPNSLQGLSVDTLSTFYPHLNLPPSGLITPLKLLSWMSPTASFPVIISSGEVVVLISHLCDTGLH